MYPEPNVPFYMALSVYLPLFVLAFLAVYGILRLAICTVARFSSMWNERGRGAFRTHGMHPPPAPRGA